jgi:integrase
MGIVSGYVLQDHEYSLARAISAKENQAQESLWSNQLPLVATPQVVQDAVLAWCEQASDTDPGALIFPAEKRAQFLGAKPMIPDNWLRLRLYPIAKQLGMTFNPSFQVLRRSFSTHGKTDGHPTDMQAQLGHTDPRTTLEIYTHTLGPEVFAMANQVANRILSIGATGNGKVP